MKAVDSTNLNTGCETLVALLSEAFDDAAVRLPCGLVPGKPPLAYWSDEDLDWNTFDTALRKFRLTLHRSPHA